MNARIYTGTLNGPHGTTVGRFVKFETAHNLQNQIDLLRLALTLICQADTRIDAIGIAADALANHDRALAAGGVSH